jgi:hypothetical protein
MDTVQIKIYKQVGANPDPGVDILLGTDISLPSGLWEINTSGWSEGRYSLYAVGYDLAGNKSGIESRSIGVLPYPMRASGLISWTVGELGNTQIGTLGT